MHLVDLIGLIYLINPFVKWKYYDNSIVFLIKNLNESTNCVCSMLFYVTDLKTIYENKHKNLILFTYKKRRAMYLRLLFQSFEYIKWNQRNLLKLNEYSLFKISLGIRWNRSLRNYILFHSNRNLLKRIKKI